MGKHSDNSYRELVKHTELCHWLGVKSCRKTVPYEPTTEKY